MLEQETKNLKKDTSIKSRQTKDEQKEVFTKEDFLKSLKKATRPILPKVSRGKGKRKTSE